MALFPSTTRARRPPTAGTTGTEAARTAEGSASISSLLHAYVVVSLMAGVRREEVLAISEKDVDLDDNPPSVAVPTCYARSGRRRHEDPEVPPREEVGAGGHRRAQGVAAGPGGREGGWPDPVGGIPAGASALGTTTLQSPARSASSTMPRS